VVVRSVACSDATARNPRSRCIFIGTHHPTPTGT